MKIFEKGLFFEKIADKILKQKGLLIVGTRIKSKTGEIDILAKNNDKTFYIVEVKHRKNIDNAAYSISHTQCKRSITTFFEFMNKNKLEYSNLYYITILFDNKKYKIINVDFSFFVDFV
ncbi:YraN family protein [Alphaproteobacteria bacterium endosymbiont of Tiliacea citrago]|uniref:YraN family protein n=1 Tax=Alphaproteobacteria bacterium endosymbiont of Tiliacea citrago TaxID=3077944 RepID=UPI00313B85B4